MMFLLLFSKKIDEEKKERNENTVWGYQWIKSLLWGIIKKKGKKKRKTENEVGGGELQKPFVLSSVHFLSAFFYYCAFSVYMYICMVYAVYGISLIMCTLLYYEQKLKWWRRFGIKIIIIKWNKWLLDKGKWPKWIQYLNVSSPFLQSFFLHPLNNTTRFDFSHFTISG